jgi:hypothetical protein
MCEGWWLETLSGVDDRVRGVVVLLQGSVLKGKFNISSGVGKQRQSTWKSTYNMGSVELGALARLQK